MSRVIGIDLGTTNCCVSVMEDGQVSVIPNTGGYKTTPSILGLTEAGKRLVGHLAKRQAVTNAKNTVFAAKRLIGRNFDSPQVQQLRELVAYKILEGPGGDARVELAGRVFTIQEIAALLLREMKRVAEEYLGEPVEQAVVTVPAYFNDTQRQTTRAAARIAGLEVLRLINEPTAAALSYGIGRGETEKVAVYDMGGGTFDITVLELSQGLLEVRATGGDTYLGGEDIDLAIVHHLMEAFEKSDGISLASDAMALQRLKDAAEKAKCDLSQVEVTEINLPFIAQDEAGQPLHLLHTLTREQIEGFAEELVENTREICRSVLADAGFEPGDIDQVLLVGGQTRMPLVQEVVTDIFGRAPYRGVNPDEVVAMGAAIQGSMLAENAEGPLLVDVTPLSLGIATFGGYFTRLIERNTTVPTSARETFTTTRDDQESVKICVLQGESEHSDDNDLLGEFALTGIRPGPKGTPAIQVTFDIDANGIVTVSARDTATDQAQSIQVSARAVLSAEEEAKLAAEFAAEGEVALRD